MSKNVKGSNNPNKLPESNRGSSDSIGAIQKRKNRRLNRGGTDEADWGAVDGDGIRNLISVISALGGTITFGYTRDKGCYYIQYYVDGDQDRRFIRQSEDINEQLRYEADDWL